MGALTLPVGPLVLAQTLTSQLPAPQCCTRPLYCLIPWMQQADHRLSLTN